MLKFNYFINLRLFYFYFLIILFFFIGCYLFVFFFILFKVCYTVEKENNEILFLDNYDEDIHFEEFLEQDVDSSYYVNFFNEEAYLISGCKFYFDFVGGPCTLELNDYFVVKNIYYNIYDNSIKNINMQVDSYSRDNLDLLSIKTIDNYTLVDIIYYRNLKLYYRYNNMNKWKK